MYEIKPVPRRKAQQLPTPSGYRILIALPEVKEKSEGGIIYDQNYLRREQEAAGIGFVLKLGPDAYSDKTRFPNGPWCGEGDWVLFRAYSGTRVRIAGKDFRIINDDTVEAVIDDPQLYERSPV